MAIGLIPLLLGLFQQVSLVSPIANCDRDSAGEPGRRAAHPARCGVATGNAAVLAHFVMSGVMRFSNG